MLKIRTNVASLRPSDTLTINQISQQLAKKGKNIYKFGFGQSPFPVPVIIQKALQQNVHQKDYLPVQGLEILREKIALHTNRLIKNSNYGVDNVFIGPGSKELIYLAQLAIDAPLLLPNPSWVSYAPQAHIIGKEVHWIPTQENHWNLEAPVLENYLQEHKIQGGILLLNYPNNPTGQTFSDEELKDLAEICRKYGIIVLSDEIYGLLNFDNTYQSIAKYYPEGTIITSGLSKWAGAGGWRLGYMIIPKELQKLYTTLCALASETFSAVSAPIQYAAVTAYTCHPVLEVYQDASQYILKKVADYCYHQLTESGIPVQPAQGGFYLFPNFTGLAEVDNAPNFCQQLLQSTGVALLPGTSFGRPAEELTTRLCFVDFDGAKALGHYYKHEKIEDIHFSALFPNIVNGLQQLTKWVDKKADIKV